MSSFEKITAERYELKLKNDHVSFDAIRLITVSDVNDTLTEKRTLISYRGRSDPAFGQLFVLRDKLSDKVRVFIIPAPDCFLPRAYIADSTFVIENGSYPVYTKEVDPKDAERAFRDWYREHYSPLTLHAMSNTWGDRNCRSRVCDDFMRLEIDSARDLGLDIVQIDDGWQTGIPDVFDEDGCRLFEGDFWELKTSVFPNGMKAISDYASENGLMLGLWFAPHSRGEFEHFERDLAVLKKAYHEWCVRYFKLDMIDLPTNKHAEKMKALITEILALDGTSIELDVTAHKRLGYLAAAPFGTIFVENRYTAWGNYYPHRTLRNEWMLSRYIPLSKLQFELLNPDLYREMYSNSDPYRHELYDIDYLFVSVMLSNPLFWMESQFLSDKSRAELKSVIPLWKKYREKLTHADVSPIGEEPSGNSLTGFIAECDDSFHLLVFRENTDRDTLTVTLPEAPSGYEMIAAKSDATVSLVGNIVSVTQSKNRSYVWVRLDK